MDHYPDYKVSCNIIQFYPKMKVSACLSNGRPVEGEEAEK